MAFTLKQYGIDAAIFDQAAVEPTDISFKEAIKFADEGNFDGFVAVGGGSSMEVGSVRVIGKYLSDGVPAPPRFSGT